MPDPANAGGPLKSEFAGDPEMMELVREWRNPRRWSALTRVTVVMTVSLLAGPTVFFAVAEARNSATWGDRTGA